MARPRKIDDFKFFAGDGKEPPDGVHVRSLADVEGAGDLMDYEDDERAIMDAQEKSVRQADRHEMEHDYRH